MARNHRKLVEFEAIKYVSKQKRVNFTTSSGQRVNFTATKKVPEKEKIRFLVKRK